MCARRGEMSHVRCFGCEKESGYVTHVFLDRAFQTLIFAQQRTPLIFVGGTSSSNIPGLPTPNAQITVVHHSVFLCVPLLPSARTATLAGVSVWRFLSARGSRSVFGGASDSSSTPCPKRCKKMLHPQMTTAKKQARAATHQAPTFPRQVEDFDSKGCLFLAEEVGSGDYLLQVQCSVHVMLAGCSGEVLWS